MGSQPPLVGREREMETLARLLERARDGSGCVAFVEGEPGIGKTRVLREALGRAAQLGFARLVGAGEELSLDRPFGPLVAALGLVSAAVDPRRAEIARLLMPGRVDSRPLLQGPALRYQVLEAILVLLEDLSAESPLVLALDDVQWADASTLLVVRHLGPRLASLRIVLLLAARPTADTTALAGVVESLREGRHLVEIGLGPLRPEQVADLARVIAKRTPNTDLLVQLSGAAGNPLLITEFVTAAQEADPTRGEVAAPHNSVEVPMSFAGVVLRRLRYLSADALHVIRVASVLGSVFSVADLALVLDRSVTDLLPMLDESRTARLLVEVDERLSFRHELIRDAVYADLPVAIRRELHAHAGRALASGGRPAGQVAAHVMRGATQGDPKAVRWLHLAAKESVELDPTVAIDLLESARELGPPASVRPDLLTDLLRAYVWSGRVLDAESLGRQLLGDMATEHGTEIVRLFLARSLLSQGRGAEALAMLEPVLADESRASDAGIALVSIGAVLHVIKGDAEAARALGERGVLVARAAGSVGDEALNLAYIGMAERAAGDPRRGVELASQAVAAAARSASGVPQFVPVYNLVGRLFIDADRMDDAESALRSGRLLTEKHGFAWGQAECHALLAELLFHLGRWDDAIAEAETAAALCAMFGAWHAFGMAKSVSALVATRRNDLERARTDIDAARERLASAPGLFGRPWVRWASSLQEEADGLDDSALRTLLSAWADSRGIVSEEASIGPDLVRLAVRLGERRVAVDVALTLRSAADRSGLPRIDAAASLCQGLVGGDIEMLEAGVAAYRTITRPYELAAACEAAGTALARSGSRETAIARLRESIEIRERLGATRDVARLESALRSLGIRRGRASTRRRPPVGWMSLTPTEKSVTHLVADGLRNREIADRLFISQRTVETHLTHIFGKLGISSRTELVARVGKEQGLVGPVARPRVGS